LQAKGALIIHEDIRLQVPACPINVVDTTAAGDAFNGVQAAALASGRPLADAVEFANAAGAFAASKAGAQVSLPVLDEVNQLQATR
jgi:ribokinase